MAKDIINEIELLRASISGNNAAFEGLVAKYQSLVCAITYGATGDVGKSEELAQETFVKAWKNLSQLRELTKFKAWLCSIARTTISNYRKVEKRNVISSATSLEAADTTPSEEPAPDHNLIAKEQQAVVAQALLQLDESYREPIILFYRHEQSVREVAVQLDLSEENVRARLSRGRKMLKQEVARMVEKTLSGTAPGKAFTVAVMASVAGITLKGTTAAAAVNVTANGVSAASSTGGAMTAFMSTVTAKVIIAASIIAIAVGGIIAYKDMKSPPGGEGKSVSLKNELPNNDGNNDDVAVVTEKDNNESATLAKIDKTEPAEPNAIERLEELAEAMMAMSKTIEPNMTEALYELVKQANLENQMESDPLDSEKVNVRIYPNWQANPTDYSMEKVGIKNRTVQFDTLKDMDDAIVVMLAEDQENPEIRKHLSQLIYAAPVDPDPNQIPFRGLFQKIPFEEDNSWPWSIMRKSRDKGEKWFIEDAEGKSIKDAKVEFFISRKRVEKRIKIGEYITDGPITRYITSGSIIHIDFIVSHPDYGIAKAKANAGGSNESANISLPLIKKGSESELLAVSGFVVDPEGKPVAGAEVTCIDITTPASGTISDPYQSPSVLTDKDGYFRYYERPKNKEDIAHYGNRIPPGSTYRMQITSDNKKLENFTGGILNGKDTLIKLQYKEVKVEGNFHTFSFYYGDEKITDPEELKLISISPFRKPDFKINEDILKSGAILPNGRCSAKYYKTGKSNLCTYKIRNYFSSLNLTDETPEELVFRIAVKTYRGRVVNAFTNEPMAGVFVVGHVTSRHKHYSMYDESRWKALESLPENPSIDDPNLCYLKAIYNFQKVARTDADGRFEITGPIMNNLVYFARGYIGLKNTTNVFKPNIDGVIEIPTRKLYPAARVRFLPKGVDIKHMLFTPEWLIDIENNPDWVAELLKRDPKRSLSFAYTESLEWSINDRENNLPRSIYVPAGVSLKLRLKTPHFQQYNDYTFDEVILLHQGETLDLGQFDFEKNIYVYAKVVDADNNPIEGFTVNQYMDNDKYYRTPSVSDKDGICEFMAPPNSSGRFAVTFKLEETKNRKHEIVSVPFKTKGYGEEAVTSILKFPTTK